MAAELEPVTAIAMVAVVTVVAFLLAVRRLERVELRGETG